MPPVATRRQGLALASLILGLLGLPTLGLLGVGALASIVLGVIALVKASREPNVYGGNGLAIAGIVASVLSILVMPFVVGIIAAIAIPSMLKARVSSNESVAIGDLRTVIQAETEFRSAHGFYAEPKCLAAPATCVPGAGSGSPFLSADLASEAPRKGYRRTFVPGPPVSSGADADRLAAWACVVVPERPGQTGVRGFCGDDTGRICFTTDGTAPPVAEGRCGSACHSLQ